MRFSRPKIASRLRRPISASTTATFFPCIANAVPRFAVVVVLPTPPLPDVIVITRLSMLYSLYKRTFQASVGGRFVLGPYNDLVYHELLQEQRDNIHIVLIYKYRFVYESVVCFYLRGGCPLIQVSTIICSWRIDSTSCRCWASQPSGGRERRCAIRNWTGVNSRQHTTAFSLSG